MESIYIVMGSFSISLIFSMVGLGGGLFFMPLFCFFTGDLETASLWSFLCIFTTTLTSATIFWRQKLVDWNLFVCLGLPLIGMVFMSGFWITSVPSDVLKMIIGLTLFLAGILMFLSNSSIFGVQRGIHFLKEYFPDKRYRFAPAVLSPVAMGIGTLCGMSGVAGGIFEMPLIAGILKTPARTAVATSSVIICLASFLGVLGRIIARSQNFNAGLPLLMFVLPGVFLGAQIGATIAIKQEEYIVKKYCGVFVGFLGLIYVVKSII